MSIIIFLIILLVLVLVHEWGHFFSAKRFGIKVDEFGFGFPPRLFGFRRGETEYTFNLFPIGGFVKIFGENPDDESMNGPDRERSFISKAKWKQAIVVFAGVFMNFVLAWFLFSFGLMTGLPAAVGSVPESELEDVSLVILSVLPGSSAEKAGLEPGDEIVSVATFGSEIGDANESVTQINPENVRDFILTHGGEEIELGYTSPGSEQMDFVTLTPTPNSSGDPSLGISMGEIGTARLSFFKAFWQGLRLTLSVTKDTAVGLYNLIIDGIRGEGSLAQVTGPVGLVGIVGDAYNYGWGYLFSFAAIISVNLAIINLLPFPALDGGRLLFLLIEKIKGSPINPKVSNMANLVGFIILILLMILVTYQDITKLI